jgi:hypothetical protein
MPQSPLLRARGAKHAMGPVGGWQQPASPTVGPVRFNDAVDSHDPRTGFYLKPRVRLDIAWSHANFLCRIGSSLRYANEWVNRTQRRNQGEQAKGNKRGRNQQPGLSG